MADMDELDDRDAEIDTMPDDPAWLKARLKVMERENDALLERCGRLIRSAARWKRFASLFDTPDRNDSGKNRHG